MLPGDKYLLRHNDHHMLPREGMYRSRGLLPMMDSTSEVVGIGLGVARLLLSAVFLIAGGAKLADPTGGRQALIGFGVPQVLTPALSAALPIAELAVALSLIPVASAWFAAIGALALLLLFVIAIAVNLALGRTPDCHCFGQLHSAPAGWLTLVRNAGLALIAGFIVFRGWENPGASVVGWLSDLTTAQRVGVVGGLAILALLGAEGALLLQILRQQGRILLRIRGLATQRTPQRRWRTRRPGYGAKCWRACAQLSPERNIRTHHCAGKSDRGGKTSPALLHQSELRSLPSSYA